MSLVVWLMRLGTEKAVISCWAKSAILWKTSSRMAYPAATLAVRKPQTTHSTALARVQPSISSPVFRMSDMVLPGVSIKTVRLLM